MVEAALGGEDGDVSVVSRARSAAHLEGSPEISPELDLGGASLALSLWSGGRVRVCVTSAGGVDGAAASYDSGFCRKKKGKGPARSGTCGRVRPELPFTGEWKWNLPLISIFLQKIPAELNC